MQDQEPTRRGGVRRTRIVQRQNATQIWWKRAVQFPRRVLQVHLNEKLGLPQCPYVVRWRAETPLGSVRVHHWLSHDDARAVHDHPWWFLTFVVKGGYADKGPHGNDHLQAPAVRFRSAAHRHTVFPDTGGCWTVLVTGRPLRKWGFWPGGKFVKANKYFLSHGHHPCDLCPFC